MQSQSQTTAYAAMPLPQLHAVGAEDSARCAAELYDAALLVVHSVPAALASADAADASVAALLRPALALLAEHAAHDHAALKKDASLIVGRAAPGGKIVVAPTGPLLRDYDDVRRYAEAAAKAVRRAKAAGTIRNPLLVLQAPPLDLMGDAQRDAYARFFEASLLAALAELHEPLEAREHLGDLADKSFASLSVLVLGGAKDHADAQARLDVVRAIETGRRLARDIGGADPERMTSIAAAETVQAFFRDAPHIAVSVLGEPALLAAEYPLLAAVARASQHGTAVPAARRLTAVVPRHAPRVVHLEYRSPAQEQVVEELYMVGKGINYDTGGADVKTGGNMIGMSRDKCGAAALAGLVAACALLRPTHLNLRVSLAFVRNSIGSNAYVSDEIIRSRAGVRVRVGNTDAEGRMVMGDLLAQMRERALQAGAAHRARLLTCATLTGHAARTYGPYTAAMDNGPARLLGISARLQRHGHLLGEGLEIATLRREDYDVISPACNREDVLQTNPQRGASASRGHQYPAAFLATASGLDKHGLDAPADSRLAYTHLDIAGSAEDGPGRLTAAPIAALAAAFLKN